MNAAHNNQFESFNGDSFVILGHGSFTNEEQLSCTEANLEKASEAKETIKEIAQNSISNGAFTSASLGNVSKSINTTVDIPAAINNGIQDLSLDHASWDCEATQDIQRKLDGLLKENIQLKETVSQNNLAMKQQVETIAMWHEEVEKIHQEHKSKFSEAKVLILKLKEENKEMKERLEQIDKTQQNTSEENSLLNENIGLRNKMEELQQRLFQSSKAEVDHRKKAFELYTLSQNVGEKLENAEKSNRQLGIEKENLIIQIDKLKEMVKKSEDELVLANQKIETLQTKNANEPSLTDYLSHVNSNQFPEYSIIQQPLLEKEVFALQAQIKNEQQQTARYKSTLLDSQEQIRSLKNNYEELLKKFNRRSSERDSMERTNATSYMDTVDALNHQIYIKDGILERKEDELRQYHESLAAMRVQCEGVEILKMQVESYKNDFEDEQKARVKAIEEKNKNAEEIRLLINNQQQLKDEILKLKNTNEELLAKVTNSGSSHQHSTNSFFLNKHIKGKKKPPSAGWRSMLPGGMATATAPEEKPAEHNTEEKVHACPVCTYRFKTLEELMQHINPCLEVNNLF